MKTDSLQFARYGVWKEGLPWPWQCGPRLLSVVSVKKYFIKNFSDFSSWMTNLRLADLSTSYDENGLVSPAAKANIQQALSTITQHADYLGLPSTSAGAKNFLDELDEILSDKKLAARIDELERRFEDETDNIFFLYITSDKISFFDGKKIPQVIRDKFQSAIYDLEEAGKCFSMNRSTGCVLHLMRALEVPIAAILKQLKLPINEKGWQSAINNINKEIIRRNSLRKKPKGWKKTFQFYSEAAVSFGHLKDAWRNHAVHGREKYDEERAEVIWNNVIALMQHLATRLSE